jgi:hypothetical protein
MFSYDKIDLNVVNRRKIKHFPKPMQHIHGHIDTDLIGDNFIFITAEYFEYIYFTINLVFTAENV